MSKRIENVVRQSVVLISLFLVVALAGIAYQGARALQELTKLEESRDRWQRPQEIIQALNIKPGSLVVDIGSGVGYFTLKLSDAVGPQGGVIAVNTRKTALLFLRLRALLRGKHNVQV